MKLSRIILPAIIAAASLAAPAASAAEPILIGRRGCAGGVENSAEAYREALRRGFKMIEGHVRITADSAFVTSHDGKTARLGGQLVVEKNTLGELKAERYTQTREDSVTYSGGITTVAEFLSICKEGGATPVLHLKKFPKTCDIRALDLLCGVIDSATDPKSVLVLTSIPEYVEHLQAVRPDIRVMFQAEGKWAERLEWCKERGLDIDMEDKYATPECVKAIHDTGLKIAVWTINDRAGYEGRGLDYVITDLLIPDR
ncbi:MAG: hypothetical protein K2H83_03850 [Duncaniella sp.]|nr:hypothetical protein [Duncaniella sp.]